MLQRMKLIKGDHGTIENWWEGEVDDDTLACSWGKTNGKTQTSSKVFPANNRSTGEQRAVTAMLQKARVKIRGGYKIESYAVAPEYEQKVYELEAISESKNVQKLTFIGQDDIGSVESLLPGILLEKVNGISCRVENGKLMSRSNKEFPNLVDLANRLFPIMDELEGVQFELYNPKMTLEEIVHDVANGGKGIDPWMFDMMVDEPACDRLSKVTKLFIKYRNDFGLKMPGIWFIHHLCDVKHVYQVTVVDNGGEGLVLHSANSGYKFGKRPSHSVKIKPTITCEFYVTDVVCDHTGKRQKVASFMVETPGGTVKVTQLGDVDKRMRMWEAYCDGMFEPIGCPLTVSFREWTKYNKPRHITEARLRVEDLEGPANEE